MSQKVVGRGENQEDLLFPKGYESGEKLQMIRQRRVFFEVKLLDWTVRHDLDGDGLFIKTILQRGEGYDRPDVYDEIEFDIEYVHNKQSIKK
jgi:hypothetical protein